MILCSYFGKIINSNDNYNLYLLSIFIEKTIFIYGAYLLCKKLDLDRKIVLLTLCTFIFTWIWSTAISTNFRAIYTYPFFLLFGFEFLKNGKASNIIFSGLSLSVTMVGTVGYYAPLILYHFIIYSIGILFGRIALLNKNRFEKIIVINKELIYSVLISFFMIGAYLLFAISVFNDPNIEFLRPGRDENMQILLNTVPSAFDLRQKELFLQIINGLPLGKFQPILNIGTIGTFGLISAILVIKKIDKLHNIFLLSGWAVIIFWLFICQCLQVYPAFIDKLPLLGYVRQTEIILAFLKIHLIFTSAVGLNYLIKNESLKKLEISKKGLNKLFNFYLLPIGISSFLFFGSFIFMFFDRRNIPSLYNVFANNSIFYYFSIKILLLISIYFIFKRFSHTKNNNLINVLVFIALIELTLNYFVLQYREDNFIKSSSIEDIRKISKLKDPFHTSKFSNEIDNLDPQFRPFAASYWSQGISTCAPRNGNDSISPRLLKLMQEGWNYDEKTIRLIMNGSAQSSINKDSKLFDKRYTLCDTGSILRNIEKIKVVNNSNEGTFLLKKLEDNDINNVDIIEDKSGQLIDQIKYLKTYPFVVKPRISVNKIQLDLVEQSNPFILYLAMNYDDKWEIKSNSRGSKIYPANISFTSIYVPPNTKNIELNYKSGSKIKKFKIMIMISAFSIFAILIKSSKIVYIDDIKK